MKRQRGITLVEMIVALSILTAVILGTAALLDRYSTDTKASVTAQHMATVAQAAQSYIKDNYSAVMAAATATTPALIRVSTLSGAGYLSSGFALANPYSQNVCVLVLEPSAGQLAALVVAEAGTAIDDLTLGRIAALQGAAGGGVYSDAATTLRGAMGGWSTAIGSFANANNLGLKCDSSSGDVTIDAGHPVQALWFSGGDVSAGFLYRDAVPGRPELNRMNTALDMNNNAINNAATVQLNTVVASGLACATTGVVARDASGAVMSCQGGTWRAQGSAYWKDPVSTFASLPAGDPVGAVRMVTGLSRAFTWNGASWAPLAVDQNGNLNVPGLTTSNAVQTYNYVQNFSENWSFLGGSTGGYNGQQQVAPGSAYLNDAYFRSVGKWASQIASAAGSGTLCGAAGQDWYMNWIVWAYCQGYHPAYGCPPGYNQVQTGYDQYSGVNRAFLSCAKS
jgi:type II secretory pathway pseudopilin PulG